MQSVYCDICKKKMDNPITDRTFYYIEKHSICEPCKDNMEASIKPTVRNKDPFAVEWYSKLVLDTLDKGVSKGRI